MRYCDLTEIGSILRDDGPLTILAGAACSRVMPTDLPDARVWRRLLLAEVVRIASVRVSEAEIDALAGLTALRLEAVLSALDEAVPGLGIDLAALAGDARLPIARRPNVIHEMLALAVTRSSDRRIITTNFDTCIEQVLRTLGVCDEAWDGDGAVPAGRRVYKIHGSADRPSSLRSTLKRIGRGFEASARKRLQDLMRSRVLVLGYYGADPDVLDLFGPGDEVWWLAVGGEERASDHGVRRVGRTRSVAVATGDFAALGAAIGAKTELLGKGCALDVDTAMLLSTRLGIGAARLVLADLTFRARAVRRSTRSLDYRVESALRRDHQPETAFARSRELSRRARFRGGGLWEPLRATVLALRAARAADAGRRPLAVSDAADALEMLGYGLITPIRAALYFVHKRCAAAAQRSEDACVAEFRAGRSALLGGRARDALGWFGAALGHREGDYFLAGIVLRWVALAHARLGDPLWRDDIDAAREAFRFEGREQELADVDRTEAVCLILVGQELSHARDALLSAVRSSRERHEPRGALRSRLALFCATRGRIGRALLRACVP